MFETFIAFKYLIPKKRALSRALISLLSIFVISLIVWLVLVFLSVTNGIEKNWIQKLTVLNAPLRISPTSEYYQSPYYQIDAHSSESDFQYKTLREKLLASQTNPYQDKVDPALPHYLEDKEISKDLVQSLNTILDTEKQHWHYFFEDFEVSAALMKLSVHSPDKSHLGSSHQAILSQMTYLSTSSENNPDFQSLITPLSSNDINLLYHEHLNVSKNENPTAFFSCFNIEKVRLSPYQRFPKNLLPKSYTFPAYASIKNNQVKSIEILPSAIQTTCQGRLVKERDKFYFEDIDHNQYPLSEHTPIYPSEDFVLNVKKILNTRVPSFKDVFLSIDTTIAGNRLQGDISFQNINIEKAHSVKGFNPVESRVFQSLYPDYEIVLAPKILQNSGVNVGDQGYLSFAGQGAISAKEHHIKILIADFYDPGVLPVGNKSLIVSRNVTQTINGASPSFIPDGIPVNGFYIWTSNLKNVPKIKKVLQEKLQEEGLSKYFKIETYQEYEFAKDLMQQFQSDKLLFMLIAIIILIVACSNIISMLVLLVNDKKREIALMKSMGATKKSIAIIFGINGMITGLIGSIIGIIAAIITLNNLHYLISFLSSLLGHSAFNPMFFGETLPQSFSYDALLFIIIATPLLSIIAGVIPAIKASLTSPSSILRSQ